MPAVSMVGMPAVSMVGMSAVSMVGMPARATASDETVSTECLTVSPAD